MGEIGTYIWLISADTPVGAVSDDGLAGLLSMWPQGTIAAGVLALVVLAIRLASSQRKITADADGRTEKSDKRYDDEVRAHQATQKLLDDERDRRRKIEDEMSELKSEVRLLRREVAALRVQLNANGVVQ